MEISPPVFCLPVSELLWLLFNFEGEKKPPGTMSLNPLANEDSRFR